MSTDPIRVIAGGPDHEDVEPVERPVAAVGPTSEQVADAVDGSLAARLRAKAQEAQQHSTKQFDVPGWDGDLVLVARLIRDRKRIAQNIRNEQFIVEATSDVLFRDDQGELQSLGGWQGVAKAMQLPDATLGQVVRTVLDNPIRLDAFTNDLVTWMAGRRSDLEQLLGE